MEGALEPPTGGGFPGFPGGPSRPGGPGGPGFPGGPVQPPPKPADKPDEPKRETHKGGSFGLEFPGVHGDFRVEGRTYPDVGFRYKGGGSYLSSAGKSSAILRSI